MRAFMPGAVILFAGLLSGCSTLNNPVIRTIDHVMPSWGSSSFGLDPRYRYLRVVVNGRILYPALGNVDHGVEVWYTSMREVLRLENGRVAGMTGTTTEWRNVSIPVLPSWSDLAKMQKPLEWIRTRDVMPGYRYGIRDILLLRVIQAPASSNLADLDPASLTWFEEEDSAKDDHLPPARYAVDSSGAVVYGESCLSDQLCFSWQRWPVERKK